MPNETTRLTVTVTRTSTGNPTNTTTDTVTIPNVVSVTTENGAQVIRTADGQVFTYDERQYTVTSNAFAKDAQGNVLLDAQGRPISYASAGGGLALDASASWVQARLSIPKNNPVSASIAATRQQVLPAIRAGVSQARLALDFLERTAPLYANAGNAVLRAAIKTLQDLLNSLKFTGHLMVVDVPYGLFYPKAPLSTGAVNRFLQEVSTLVPDSKNEIPAIPGTQGGVDGLRQLLLASLDDAGDTRRPILDAQTSVVGFSLVAGTGATTDVAAGAAAFRKIVDFFSKFLEVDTQRSTELPTSSSEGPYKLKVRQLPSGVEVSWQDRIPAYPATTVNGGVRFYAAPPVNVSVYVATRPDVTVFDPYKADTAQGWLFVKEVEFSDPTTTSGDGSVYIAAAELPGGGSRASYRLCVQFYYERTELLQDDGQYLADYQYRTPPAYVDFVPAPQPAKAGAGVAPDWYNWGTDAWKLKADGSAVGQFVDEWFAGPGAALGDLLQDTSDTLMQATKSGRAALTALDTQLSELDRLVAAFEELLALDVQVYARAFQYVVPSTPEGWLDPTRAPLVGKQALVEEYTKSLGSLPYKDSKDFVAGVFYVSTLPAGPGQQLVPFLAAWNNLLTVLGLQAIQNGPDQMVQITLGPTPNTPAPPIEGTTAAVSQTLAAPLVGTTEETAVAAGAAVDFNCPPPRDLSTITFTGDFKVR